MSLFFNLRCTVKEWAGNGILVCVCVYACTSYLHFSAAYLETPVSKYYSLTANLTLSKCWHYGGYHKCAIKLKSRIGLQVKFCSNPAYNRVGAPVLDKIGSSV